MSEPLDFSHVPPAVMEMFKLLPDPGAEFPVESRVQFLKALTCIFFMVYGPCDPLKIETPKRGAGVETKTDTS